MGRRRAFAHQTHFKHMTEKVVRILETDHSIILIKKNQWGELEVDSWLVSGKESETVGGGDIRKAMRAAKRIDNKYRKENEKRTKLIESIKDKVLDL
jgi:hypothetical protein